MGGVVTESQGDTDFNGKPDVTTTYINGAAVESNWRPNGAKHVTLRQLFKNSVLQEEWSDTNADGQFDLKTVYNPFQQAISTESLPPPLVYRPQ